VSDPKGRRQTVQNQKPETEELAAARGFNVVETYVDHESAVKRRPGYERMLTDARRGRFKVVVCWSLDRLGRGFSCFDAFRDLARIGVRVVTVREPWTEQEGPALELLVAVMAWVSGFERQRLIERISAGLERVRKEESTPHGRAARRAKNKLGIGRPSSLPADGAEHVKKLRAEGKSWREIAKAVGCSPWAARRAAA
jgi:DNA invertase Pin-like site-specific DNA recombinase